MHRGRGARRRSDHVRERGSRTDGGREGGIVGKGAPGGRQGFVSLSVGNQVSGPVGRPLSISVLLAVQHTVPRVRVALSRALTLCLPLSFRDLDTFVSFSRCSRLYRLVGFTIRLYRQDRSRIPLVGVMTLAGRSRRSNEKERVAAQRKA